MPNDKVEMGIYIECHCENCGEPLQCNSDQKIPGVIHVVPCEPCEQKQYDDGFADGKNEAEFEADGTEPDSHGG